MTHNSKTPPAKKTIQDPPEYAAGRMGTGNITRDWLGGPQNGVEDEVNDRGRVPADDINEKKAPKGSLSGGVDEQEGGGPDV